MKFSNTIKTVLKIYQEYVKSSVWFGTGGPVTPQIENPRYDTFSHFLIAVNTRMNVLANLRYLASCCIIFTEETKHCPELIECISRRVTSFVLTSLSLRIAVKLHALYFRLCWDTRRLQDSGLGSAALRADSAFQIIFMHATNSLLQCIRLPLLTMHMLCL